MIFPFLKLNNVSSHSRAAATRASGYRTGLPRLDAQLPQGGWPIGAVTELCPTHDEIGEFSVLVPTLARLTQQGRRVVLMGSEQLPDLESLGDQGVRLRQVMVLGAAEADRLWAMEQKLRSGEVAMLVAWMPQLNDRQVRRLEEAAASGQAMVILFRDAATRSFCRSSTLQLVLRPGTDGLLDIEIAGSRAGAGGRATVSGTRHGPRRSTARPLSWTPAFASANY